MQALNQFRFPVRLGGVCLVSLLIPVAQAGALGQVAPAPAGFGGPDDPIDVILPFGIRASFLYSLPIAGLLVTPDQVAQLVLMNPRLRVTTGLPISGKGTANPVNESGVADTHADPMD